MMTTRHILITLISSISSAFLAVMAFYYFLPPQTVVVREVPEAQFVENKEWIKDIRPRTFLSSSPTDFTQAAALSIHSVVSIRAVQGGERSSFLQAPEEAVVSTGSGVIVGEEGYIVTNSHVVQGADMVEVVLNDKREFEAEVLGVDSSTDIALLRIRGTSFPAIEFGNSDSLLIGEWVLAVGNPFNLENTVTAGIVSAKGRNIDILEGQDRIESFIQTDAVVNPGNSGGALVNSNGELVGINTAIITRSGAYEGYSFAVPVNLVSKIVKDLRDYGAVQRGLLGVFIDDLSATMAKDLGLDEISGVLITRISENGGADKAGLMPGDVITAVNGQATKSASALQEVLGRLRPGNTVELSYIRETEQEQVSITLTNKLNSTNKHTAADANLIRDLGFELRNLNNTELNRLEKEGVKVLSIYRDSKIDASNMEPGFIITHIDKKRIQTVDRFLKLLRRSRGTVVLQGFYEHYEGEYFYSVDAK